MLPAIIHLQGKWCGPPRSPRRQWLLRDVPSHDPRRSRYAQPHSQSTTPNVFHSFTGEILSQQSLAHLKASISGKHLQYGIADGFRKCETRRKLPPPVAGSWSICDFAKNFSDGGTTSHGTARSRPRWAVH